MRATKARPRPHPPFLSPSKPPTAPFGDSTSITTCDTHPSCPDVTGLNALYEHRDSPLVKAPGYFYIHDTCLVHPGFSLFWDRLKTEFQGTGRTKILSTEPPWTSNIAAFGYGVVGNIGTAFRRNFTKYEAQTLEGRGDGIVNPQFGGNVTWVRERVVRFPSASCVRCLPPALSPGAVLQRVGLKGPFTTRRLVSARRSRSLRRATGWSGSICTAQGTRDRSTSTRIFTCARGGRPGSVCVHSQRWLRHVCVHVGVSSSAETRRLRLDFL